LEGLGRENELLSTPGNGRANDLFVLAIAVNAGRVHVIDAAIERRAVTLHRLTIGSADAQPRDGQPRATENRYWKIVAHLDILSSSF
jgi:hypothetical protein